MKLFLIVLLGLIAISTAAKKKGGAKVGPCDAKKLEYTKKKTEANGKLVGLEEPRCDKKTGNFLGMQFQGATAFCVTKNGTTIEGYTVNRVEAGPDMTCQCARDKYDYQMTRLVGKMHSCDPNGNYAKVGCNGSVCYCQNKKGKKVGKKEVPIHQKLTLKCI